jgi:predicted amidophosphoribosyltransferase
MRAAIAFALPQRCALCARATGDACLCDGCASAIAPAGPACPRCALPTPAGAVCGRCVAHPPAFDAALAAGLYAFPLDRLVMRLKYAADLPLAAALGAQLARAAAVRGRDSARRRLGADAARGRQQRSAVATRRARSRRRSRARPGLPIARGLVRLKHGAPQAALPWRERERNVRGAFARRGVRRRAARARRRRDDDRRDRVGRAAALRRAGAAHVEAWVVARTPAT